MGEADLLIQVNAILEQPHVSSSSVLDGPILAWRPVEVPMGPVIDPTFDMSSEGPTLYTNKVVKDVQCCNCAKKLEVGEEETVPKLDISWLKFLCAGLCHIEDSLLFWIVDGVGEGKVGVAVLSQIVMGNGLECVLHEYGRLTADARGF